MSQGLTAAAFSFNSGSGRCERCSGTGFEKIEMQFLSDLYVRCAECEGRRFQPHVLKIRMPVDQKIARRSVLVLADARFGERRIAQSREAFGEISIGVGQPFRADAACSAGQSSAGWVASDTYAAALADSWAASAMAWAYLS